MPVNGMDVTQEDVFGDFRGVAYDERASFNVLSVHSLPTSANVTYDHSERCHTIVLNNNTYHFKVPGGEKGTPCPCEKDPHHHLYVRSDQHSGPKRSHPHKARGERAKIASELTRMLAHPSLII